MRAGRRDSLRRRHQLLRTAQAILYRAGIEHRQQHRTVWCHRHVVTEGAMPVFRQLDGSRARLAKVKTCGSVWSCPVCAAKVATQRQAELGAAVVSHVASGGMVYLLTFTFPHYVGQPLADLMPRFDKARQRFQNAKGWKAVMGKDGTAGRVGSVTSLEVTYGAAAGWHPHLHMLVFCQPGAWGEGEADEQGRLSSKAIDYFRGEWVRQLERAGLVDGSNRSWANVYSLDVRGGKQAAEYVAKWGHEQAWGLSSELTSSHAKTGRRDTWGTRDHYTPFQLLELAREGDGHAMCAFREFVAAFDGKRMLTWSPGLKAHFSIAELTDEEAAAEPELTLQDEHQVGELQAEQLQVLTKWGRLGDFLAWVAEHGHQLDQGGIDAWVSDVPRGGGRAGRGNIVVDRLQVLDYSYRMRPEEVEG